MISLPAEELKLLKRYILLPLIMSALENDKKHLQHSFKTRGTYVRVIDRTIDKATKDLKETRRAMRKTELRVYESESKSRFAVRRNTEDSTMNIAMHAKYWRPRPRYG